MLEKLACNGYFPNTTRIHNAMRCWRLLHFNMQSMPRDVDIPCPYTHGRRRAMLTQRFEQRRLARSFSGNWAPISRTRGWKSSPDFRWRAARGRNRGLQACVPPTRPKPGGQQGHTSSFAAWPSPPVPARPNPKSKILTPNGPFGFWILEFGFRIRIWI